MATDRLENKKITIIGSGNIAQALVAGLARGGIVHPRCITVSNPLGIHLQAIKKEFSINVSKNNRIAVSNADWIFLAVKPKTVQEVMREVKKSIDGKLIVSFAAGVKLQLLKSYAPNIRSQFIRMMPNIAIAHNEGVIGVFAPDCFRSKERKVFFKVMEKLGCLVEVEQEDDLDVLTLISGCGPAVVLKCIEVFVRSGVKAGLPPEIALRVVLQTFTGTLTHLYASKKFPSALIKTIATKGGISEAMLKELEGGGFEKIFQGAMGAGDDRIKVLQRSLMRHLIIKSHPQD